MKRFLPVAALAAVLVLALAVPALAATTTVQKSSANSATVWIQHGSYGYDDSGFETVAYIDASKSHVPTQSAGQQEGTIFAFGSIWSPGQYVGFEIPSGGYSQELTSDQLVFSGDSLRQAKAVPATFTDWIDPNNPVEYPGTVTFDLRGAGAIYKNVTMDNSFLPGQGKWVTHDTIKVADQYRLAVATVSVDCPGLGLHQVVSSDAINDSAILLYYVSQSVEVVK